ncbi:MAG: Rpn family recombination-promoting nuclease/putative transposase [Bacilli bacterium]|nr:Rpn family recombination-promoting nuclease/putative transposase [Bacilli bacterium]
MKNLKYYEMLDKKNPMIPLSYDYLSKSIFQRDEKFLRLFLNSQLKAPLGINFLNKKTKIRLASNEVPKEIKNEHQNKVDILLYVNEKILINIEINTEYFKSIYGRNLIYFLKLTVSTFKSGDESKNIKEYTVHQLNLNINKGDKKYASKDIKLFKEEELEDLIDEIGDYMIHIKNIAYYYDLYYNKHIKLNVSQMWLLLFSARSYTEIYRIANEIMSKEDASMFMEEMEKLNSDDFVLSQWEQRQLDQMVRDNELKYAREDAIKEGRKEGIKQNKAEIAKKMIEEKLDIKFISKITGLTEKEIENLK